MKKPTVTRLHNCRICGGEKLDQFLRLPMMPFTDDFVQAGRFGDEFRADIDIYICCDCVTAQTQHNVDVGDYYEDYQYSVGGSTTASHFMRKLAHSLQSVYFPNTVGKRVLEVGSGDGEQLLAFKEIGCDVVGYEPSSTLCRTADTKGIPTIQGLFDANSINRLPASHREVDVVMLSYTFDHLPDPRSFLSATRSILNPTHGLLVVEIHDLEKILERQEYCLFEHEHSIYLTEATAQKLCQLEGLEIIDFDLVSQCDRRANSLIFVATPRGSNHAVRAVTPRTPREFSDPAFYKRVGEGIRGGITNLERYVDETLARGKTLAGYGAGGRGVMTLAAMTNASKLRYLVDKKPKRPGLVVPKSGIPLVGLEVLKSDPVDEILVFSFGYMKEIQRDLAVFGYKPEQFRSLVDVLAGRF